MEFLPVAAVAAGLISSSHCLAMCGGIASALGLGAAGRASHAAAAHQLGRLASYATLGALAGYLGAGFAAALGGAHAAQYLRIATAGALLLIGMRIFLGGRGGWLQAPERWGAALWRRVAPPVTRRLPAAPLPRALLVGALWGWLPCGLVYSMLLVAAFSGGPARGAGLMFAFGLGTVPAVVAAQLLGTRLRGAAAPRRVLGAAVATCGIWTALLPVSALSGLSGLAAHCRALIP
ncbi:MAG: sulfite exporter TauE/SafE family protein [Proteobacteria bacterium]|nr:sulfite exporter TauE/SafE family protein [Pseudomonadota bacterium]